MDFKNIKRLPSESDIKEVEDTLKIKMPDDLKFLFLKFNGGKPNNSLFEDDLYELMVNNLLTLKLAKFFYSEWIIDKQLLGTEFFPFAEDSGGNKFFVNCNTQDGQVFFWGHDDPEEGLYDLQVGVSKFINMLEPYD